MIIGNGLLANCLKGYDRSDILFLASGVSDSKCDDSAEFERERMLLVDQINRNQEKLIVYFSTCSIHDPAMSDNMYVRRKLEYEALVQSQCQHYLIVRVSNLVGKGGNPNNIFNFFLNSVYEGKSFRLWANAKRNLILTEDFARILSDILQNRLEEKANSVIHIFNPRYYTALEIVEGIESFTGKKAIFELVDKASEAHVIDSLAETEFNHLGIDTENYLMRILETHFMEYKSAESLAF